VVPDDGEDNEETLVQEHAETEETASATVCLNNGNNTAEIHG
jgi:hypothetical protein